jgi:hypothetical protein
MNKVASKVLRDGDLTITVGPQSPTPHVATVEFRKSSLALHLEPKPALHFKVGNYHHTVLLELLSAPPGGVATMKAVTPNKLMAGSSPLPMPTPNFADASVMPYVEVSNEMARV